MKLQTFALAASGYLIACSAPSDNRAESLDGNFANLAAIIDAAPILPPYDPKNVPGMARVADKSYVLKSALWPNKNIAVCWETSNSPPERQSVQDAVAQSWQANSKIKFYGWGQCAANARGIRIAVADVGPHTKGLGKEIDATPQGMVLNFTFASWSPACAGSPQVREMCIRSIAVHEFGHALGFAHEQNRSDTPGACVQKPQGGNGDLMLTPWDPHSVMNYCNPLYNNEGKLSALDEQTIRAIYP